MDYNKHNSLKSILGNRRQSDDTRCTYTLSGRGRQFQAFTTLLEANYVVASIEWDCYKVYDGYL